MLLAGGQGSRLGILTRNMAKPAVPFGGKYRIIDFTLSNCTNSVSYTHLKSSLAPLKRSSMPCSTISPSASPAALAAR